MKSYCFLYPLTAGSEKAWSKPLTPKWYAADGISVSAVEVTCNFTADNEITSVDLDGKMLEISGDQYSLVAMKTVSFIYDSLAKNHLRVKAKSLKSGASVDYCISAGFLLHCEAKFA